jgi:hypothetical protein
MAFLSLIFFSAGPWWFTLVIPTTQGAEVRRVTVLPNTGTNSSVLKKIHHKKEGWQSDSDDKSTFPACMRFRVQTPAQAKQISKYFPPGSLL